MRHTYFDHGSCWDVQGRFSDGAGEVVGLDGLTRLSRDPERWTLDASLRVLTEPALEMYNRYEIVPFVEGATSTTWSSFNPTLGRLRGTFVVIGDTILSLLASEDGRMNGGECLILRPDGSYDNRGVLCADGEPVATWETTLRLCREA